MDMNKHIKDGVFLAILYIGMMLIAMVIPSVFLVFVFFLPIPFIIYASRYNIQLVLIMVVATGLVVFTLSILIENMILQPVFVLTAAGGIAIGIAISKRKSAYETWMQGTIGFVFGLLFVFLFTQFVFEINWTDEINRMIEDSLMMSREMVEQFGAGEQIDEQFDLVEEQMEIFTDLIPAGIALIAIGMAFLTQWLSYRVLSQLENRRLRFPPVRQLRFPMFVIWVYIIVLIITFIESNSTSAIYIGAQNILTLAGFLMILQGFSFVFFYAHHKRKSNALPVIVIILSVLLPPLLYVIRILGIIDMAFALRSYLQQREEDKKR